MLGGIVAHRVASDRRIARARGRPHAVPTNTRTKRACTLRRPAVGWVVRLPAVGDEAIYDAYMREAGDTGRTEAAVA